MSPAAEPKRRGLRAPHIVLFVLALCCAAIGVYAGVYSHADAAAQEALSRAVCSDGVYAFGDPAAETALLLYPGGKVEYAAYAPLAEEIAAKAGVLCIVPEMPLHLAVLGKNRATAIMARYPGAQVWTLGGHSIGGAMAAAYAAENPSRVKGVVLLAAYSTEPLSMPVLSVYGSEDGVLSHEKYDEYRKNLPAACTETILSGGNHAQFGCYGAQAGDGAATLSASAQRSATAQAIADFLKTLS